jgi:hypothetical protein
MKGYEVMESLSRAPSAEVRVRSIKSLEELPKTMKDT